MNNLTEASQMLLILSSDLVFKSRQKRFSIDPKRLIELFRNSISPGNLFEASLNDLKELFNTEDDEAMKIRELINSSAEVALEYERLTRIGINITTIYEPDYPVSLKQKLGDDAPPFIYYAGDLSIFNTDGVAIVGSRNVNEEGSKIAYKLGELCARESLTVFSGGAKGVDSLSQQGCLDNGGKVVSILSCEMSRLIKSKVVRDYIMNGNLLLVSAVHPGTKFNVVSAMRRNKYIYAASKGAIVVSSDKEKGGTWAGAMENLRKKYVPLFVVKYDSMPEGNVELLKNPEVTLLEISDDISLRKLLIERNSKRELGSESKRRRKKKNPGSKSGEQLRLEF